MQNTSASTSQTPFWATPEYKLGQGELSLSTLESLAQRSQCHTEYQEITMADLHESRSQLQDEVRAMRAFMTNLKVRHDDVTSYKWQNTVVPDPPLVSFTAHTLVKVGSGMTLTSNHQAALNELIRQVENHKRTPLKLYYGQPAHSPHLLVIESQLTSESPAFVAQTSASPSTSSDLWAKVAQQNKTITAINVLLNRYEQGVVAREGYIIDLTEELREAEQEYRALWGIVRDMAEHCTRPNLTEPETDEDE